jgi:uncharacterized membrane protein
MDPTAAVNLDLLPLGWVHFIASLVALAVGGLVLVRTKGTAAHRRSGRVYLLAIVLTSMTALIIYRLGVFFFPHWFAIAALTVTGIGVGAAHFKKPRTGWTHLHLTCMLLSLYILIGGGVNELFLRVGVLHRLVPDSNSPVLGMTHSAVMIVFAGLIAYFNSTARMRSNGPVAAPAE